MISFPRSHKSGKVWRLFLFRMWCNKSEAAQEKLQLIIISSSIISFSFFMNQSGAHKFSVRGRERDIKSEKASLLHNIMLFNIDFPFVFFFFAYKLLHFLLFMFAFLAVEEWGKQNKINHFQVKLVTICQYMLLIIAQLDTGWLRGHEPKTFSF